jgi:hypothetical protein
MNMGTGWWTVSVICVFLCLIIQPSTSQHNIYPSHGYEYTTEHSHVRVVFGGQASYPFAQGLSVNNRGAGDQHSQYYSRMSHQALRENSPPSTQLPPPPLFSSSTQKAKHQHYLFSSQKQSYSLPTSLPNHNSVNGDQPDNLLRHPFYTGNSYPSTNMKTIQNQADITLQKCQNLTKIFNIPIPKQSPLLHRIPIYLDKSTAKSMNNLQPGKITSENGANLKSKYKVLENFNHYFPKVKKHNPKPTNIPSVQFEPLPAYKKRIKTQQVTPSPLYREENIKLNRLVRFPDE